jgi:hypothetical protein
MVNLCAMRGWREPKHSNLSATLAAEPLLTLTEPGGQVKPAFPWNPHEKTPRALPIAFKDTLSAKKVHRRLRFLQDFRVWERQNAELTLVWVVINGSLQLVNVGRTERSDSRVTILHLRCSSYSDLPIVVLTDPTEEG